MPVLFSNSFIFAFEIFKTEGYKAITQLAPLSFERARDRILEITGKDIDSDELMEGI